MDKTLILQVFLVIVIITGSSWLGYDLYTNKPIIVKETSEEEVAQKETTEENLVEGWQTYTSEEHGFSFQYPGEWGRLSLESTGGDSHTLRATNEDLIKTVVYHKLSKQLIFVEKGEEYSTRFPSYPRKAQESIRIIQGDRNIRTMYEVPEHLVEEFVGISDLVPSPGGRYLQFNLIGWEWWETRIFDLEREANILDDASGNPRAFMGEVIWLDGDNLLFAASHSNKNYGYGFDEILISDYDNPTKLNSLPLEVLCDNSQYVFDYELGDVTLDNNQISFLLSVSCIGDDWLEEDYEKIEYKYFVDTRAFFRAP